jgi:microcystin-dependent protein
MADQFVGQILLFSCNFAPTGFAMCQGQVIAISQNTALFSLLGTMYGGDGKSTFALPDLRGRVPMGVGQGPGLSSRVLGEIPGSDSVTLLLAEAAAHTHSVDVSGLAATVHASSAGANNASPVGDVPAVESPTTPATYSTAAPDTLMAAGTVLVGGTMTASAIGGAQPHDNHQPYQTLNYCIALTGVFPSRP